jgi:hypothetical protein
MIDEFQDIGQDYIDFIEAIAKKSEFSDTKIRIIAT